MDKNSVREKVIEWNLNFPIDRWWRKKHGVAFGSPEHREISFIDQLFEFEEDKLFEELSEENEYKPNVGDWLKVDDLTNEQFIEQAREEMKNFPELE